MKKLLLLIPVLIAGFFFIKDPSMMKGTKGIDISHHNNLTKQDWKILKNKGVKFVYIKVTEGATYTDPMWQTHAQNAKDNEMLIGYYHFFRDDVTAEEQYKHFKPCERDNWQLIPCIDYEKDGFTKQGAPKRVARLQRLVELFVQDTGFYPIIYCTIIDYYKLKNKLPDCGFWLSHNSPCLGNPIIQQRIKKVNNKEIDFDYTNNLGWLIFDS